MAEFLNQEKPAEPDFFAQMGKPIPVEVRQAALEHCRQMGLDTATAWMCVGDVAAQLERDEPYLAQGAGMKYLDLTGTYRVMSVLLTPKESL